MPGPSASSLLSARQGRGLSTELPAAIRPLGWGSAAALVGVPFLWLGMVIAISFVETPLKFQAPGVTLALGLGIGRLVFRALNGLELAAAVALAVVIVRARPVPHLMAGLLGGLWGILLVQAVALRPVLDARTVQIMAGSVVPDAPWHLLYIALEVVKAAVLLLLGVAATSFALGRAKRDLSGWTALAPPLPALPAPWDHESAEQVTRGADPAATTAEKTATRPRPGPRPARQLAALTGSVRSYVSLTKPRIIELLLITTVPAMVLAAHGAPDPLLVLATLLGGTCAAASANTLNCFLDRDIDGLMRRTSRRPLVTGEITPGRALTFGLMLGVLGVGWLGLMVNVLAAGLALAAIVAYVLGYTVLLKRRTPQNIVWGGAAGCMPVLIGWAAVRGRLDWAPLVLFLVVFFWTPAHYWPLALRFRADYAAAGVPMLPVVVDAPTVVRRVLTYSWLTVGTSLLLWPVARTGPVYAVAAVVLGAVFLWQAHRLHACAQRGETGAALAPLRLFHYSNAYLALLFIAVAVDGLLSPWWR